MSTGAPGPHPSGHREPGMWQQFRRRRVTRTVLLYLAHSYLAVEAALFTATRVELPSWGLRAVFGVVVLGFPFAVVLAWTYDITPQGVVRTPDDPGSAGTEAQGPLLRRSAWLLFCALLVALGVVFRSLRL